MDKTKNLSTHAKEMRGQKERKVMKPAMATELPPSIFLIMMPLTLKVKEFGILLFPLLDK